MTEPLCIKIAAKWTPLPLRSTEEMVVNADGIAMSYEALAASPVAEQKVFGAFRPEPPPPTPEGKEVTNKVLNGGDRPVWVMDYGDIRPVEPPKVSAVTPAQAKVALFNRGLLDQVKAIIDVQDYEPIKIFYSDASMWEKSNPYLQAIAMQLGLVVYDDAGNEDATELDKVFYEASKL